MKQMTAMWAGADIIAQCRRAQQLFAAAPVTFGKRHRGRNDRAAGMKPPAHMAVICFIRVGGHGVCKGSLRGAHKRPGPDCQRFFRPPQPTGKLGSGQPSGQCRARNDGGNRVKQMQPRLFGDVFWQRGVECRCNIGGNDRGLQTARRIRHQVLRDCRLSTIDIFVFMVMVMCNSRITGP